MARLQSKMNLVQTARKSVVTKLYRQMKPAHTAREFAVKKLSSKVNLARTARKSAVTKLSKLTKPANFVSVSAHVAQLSV